MRRDPMPPPGVSRRERRTTMRIRTSLMATAVLIGLGLGVLGGIAAGDIEFLIGTAKYPSLEL